MIYVPPPNFGHVDNGIYRSGLPTELSFPFLELLQLKAVVYVGVDSPSTQFLNFLDDQGIEFFHLGGADGKQSPSAPLTEDAVVDALQRLLSAKFHPICVMCNQGTHRTGTVVGCLRKIQNWNLTSILDEYRRHNDRASRLINEQFIELFDVDLVKVPPPDIIQQQQPQQQQQQRVK